MLFAHFWTLISIKMNPEQFQIYTQHLANAEEQRRNEEGARQRRKDQKELVSTLVKQTTKCDGATSTSVRNWIKEIDLARARVGDQGIIEVVTSTITGPLRFETEREIQPIIDEQEIDRALVPWQRLRDHIRVQFLKIDEAATLRDEVEKITQSAYEPDAHFSRRFREMADAAYPPPRNNDQERILVKVFARGLKCDQLARKLIEDAHPNTLEGAIQSVAELSERKDAYLRIGRQEEPMDIGMVSQDAAATTKSTEEMLQQIIKGQQRIDTKTAKFEAKQRELSEHVGLGTAKDAQGAAQPFINNRGRGRGRGRPMNRQFQPQRRKEKSAPERKGGNSNTPRRTEWNQEGKPQCWECGQFGHFARDCAQTNSGNMQAS